MSTLLIKLVKMHCFLAGLVLTLAVSSISSATRVCETADVYMEHMAGGFNFDSSVSKVPEMFAFRPSPLIYIYFFLPSKYLPFPTNCRSPFPKTAPSFPSVATTKSLEMRLLLHWQKLYVILSQYVLG